MTDFDASGADAPGSSSLEDNDDVSLQRPTGLPIAREGLPKSYRMRAERHYVDHIASNAVGSPVRLIPVGQFASAATWVSTNLEPLVKSIAQHGVLQPLLVRKQHGEYVVIAGRKRLAAAVAAGVTEVPCLVHQIGDADAAALAAAENTRLSSDASARVTVAPPLGELLQEIAGDLTRIARSATFLKDTPKGYQQNAAVDLIAAQAWRTSWLARAMAFTTATRRSPGKRRHLAAVIERVVDGFEPERRLSGLELRVNLPSSTSIMVDGDPIELALTGAVFTSLALLDDVEAPALEIGVQASSERGTELQVAQRITSVSDNAVRAFAGPLEPRATRGFVAFAALALKQITAQYDGTSELVTNHDCGSVVRCTFRAVSAL